MAPLVPNETEATPLKKFHFEMIHPKERVGQITQRISAAMSAFATSTPIRATSPTVHRLSRESGTCVHRDPSRQGELSASPGDRRNQHDLVAVLKGVGFSTKKPNVFVVDVNIDEAPELAGFILDLGCERWKILVDIGDKARQIGRLTGELFLAIGVSDEGGWKYDLDRNGPAPFGFRRRRKPTPSFL